MKTQGNQTYTLEIADLAYDAACDLQALAKGIFGDSYREMLLGEAARLAFAAGVLRQAVAQQRDEMAERVTNRILELIQKRRRTRAEETELAILTYEGPRPRVLPPSDEVPF